MGFTKQTYDLRST